MANLDALRDWSHAKDYVCMQWMQLQQDKADYFVIVIGEAWAATVAAIKGDKAPGLKVCDVVVKIYPRYFRPAEVETLRGDPFKAKAKLGWTPEITVQQMCAEMVAADSEEAKKHGYNLNVVLSMCWVSACF
jgi:GDPmannose 4,6-dehydratase